MFKPAMRARIGLDHGQAEAWLMSFVRRLTDRLARPSLMWPDELSPHLRRDIGLEDGHDTTYRWRP